MCVNFYYKFILIEKSIKHNNVNSRVAMLDILIFIFRLMHYLCFFK